MFYTYESIHVGKIEISVFKTSRKCFIYYACSATGINLIIFKIIRLILIQSLISILFFSSNTDEMITQQTKQFER